jgi:hypothetical protein
MNADQVASGRRNRLLAARLPLCTALLAAGYATNARTLSLVATLFISTYIATTPAITRDQLATALAHDGLYEAVAVLRDFALVGRTAQLVDLFVKAG